MFLITQFIPSLFSSLEEFSFVLISSLFFSFFKKFISVGGDIGSSFLSFPEEYINPIGFILFTFTFKTLLELVFDFFK